MYLTSNNHSCTFSTALETEPKKATLCSDCGPNAQCVNNRCQCRENYLGQPPFCRAECLTSTDCSWNLTCLNRRCVDPCPGACGYEALCTPVAHEPRCDCPPSTTGNPLVQCQPIEIIRKTKKRNRVCFFQNEDQL